MKILAKLLLKKQGYSVSVQDKQDEDEISEAEEYDSFITDQSDETYKTEDSIYYADNLKSKNLYVYYVRNEYV